MRRIRGLVAVLIAVSIALTTSACSDDDGTKPSDLPGETSASASATGSSSAETSPSDPPESEEQAVIAAYKGWFEAVNGMGLATDEEVAAALAPYATEELVQNAVSVFSAERSKGVIPGGAVNFGPLEVGFDGNSAVVLECRDSSSETSVDVTTGNVVGTGSPGTRYEAQLSENPQGVWLMSDYGALPDQC